jgi:hypothetical protein
MSLGKMFSLKEARRAHPAPTSDTLRPTRYKIPSDCVLFELNIVYFLFYTYKKVICFRLLYFPSLYLLIKKVCFLFHYFAVSLSIS